MIRVGPAGWSYPDSPGKVYPKGRGKKLDPLAYLADYFDTIEINSTFYAPAPPRSFESWVRRVAANPRFRFTAKLWQRFTHAEGSGSDTAGDWADPDVRSVTEGFAVLRDAGLLGAVLAQFPWSFKATEENRGHLKRLAESFAGWPLAVELRHGSWARREHALLLKDLGLGFANIDQPIIGSSVKPTAGATSAVGYVRFHGRNYDRWIEHEESHQRYDYLYSAEELEPWVQRIRKVATAEGVQDVYVILNNHYEGKGPANALMIRSMLEGRKVAAPPTLFATYRSKLEPYAEVAV
jgi:uncharacterized protein YecE (DUF72 family)